MPVGWDSTHHMIVRLGSGGGQAAGGGSAVEPGTPEPATPPTGGNGSRSHSTVSHPAQARNGTLNWTITGNRCFNASFRSVTTNITPHTRVNRPIHRERR